MFPRFFLCGLALVALNACAPVAADKTADERPAVVKLQSGQRICAVHHVPLTTIKGYRDPTLLEAYSLSESDRKREAQNPNSIPFAGYSRTRTKECTEPTEISYCPSCQAAMEGQSVYYGDNSNH